MRELKKINIIAKEALENPEGTDYILLFRKIVASYPGDEWKETGEDELCDFVNCFESETDRIAKSPQQKARFSAEELKEQAAYEKHCLKNNREEIQEVLEKLSRVGF